jgi:hypothetical protein
MLCVVILLQLCDRLGSTGGDQIRRNCHTVALEKQNFDVTAHGGVRAPSPNRIADALSTHDPLKQIVQQQQKSKEAVKSFNVSPR